MPVVEKNTSTVGSHGWCSKTQIGFMKLQAGWQNNFKKHFITSLIENIFFHFELLRIISDIMLAKSENNY